MTSAQEKAITLALNILHVSFFECPKHYYEYFIKNDEWALLMAAADVNDVDAQPQPIALAVLANAVAHKGLFADMTEFEPPAHYCSFLREQIGRGERKISLHVCEQGQQGCPYASFENLQDSGQPRRE